MPLSEEDVYKYMRRPFSLSPKTPITLNSTLPPAPRDDSFNVWSQNGIKKIEDLYKGNALMSFENLRGDYQISATHFFRYLQVQHFIQSKHGGSLDRAELSLLESLLLKDDLKKHISQIYILEAHISSIRPRIHG